MLLWESQRDVLCLRRIVMCDVVPLVSTDALSCARLSAAGAAAGLQNRGWPKVTVVRFHLMCVQFFSFFFCYCTVLQTFINLLYVARFVIILYYIILCDSSCIVRFKVPTLYFMSMKFGRQVQNHLFNYFVPSALSLTYPSLFEFELQRTADLWPVSISIVSGGIPYCFMKIKCRDVSLFDANTSSIIQRVLMRRDWWRQADISSISLQE